MVRRTGRASAGPPRLGGVSLTDTSFQSAARCRAVSCARTKRGRSRVSVNTRQEKRGCCSSRAHVPRAGRGDTRSTRRGLRPLEGVWSRHGTDRQQRAARPATAASWKAGEGAGRARSLSSLRGDRNWRCKEKRAGNASERGASRLQETPAPPSTSVQKPQGDEPGVQRQGKRRLFSRTGLPSPARSLG